MKKLYILTVKDLLIVFSYRLEFMLRFFGLIFTVVLWHFLAQLIGSNQPGYFEYVIMGIAVHGFLMSHLQGTAGRVREEQVTGTLESILATPTPPYFILLGGVTADFINALMNFLFIIAAATILGGFSPDMGSVFGFLLALLLTAGAFASLGTLSGSAIILFQKGNPFNFFILSMQALLGSVFFPIDLLPDWLRGIAYWMPMTQALIALRETMLHGAGIHLILPQLLYLLLFSLCFFFLGAVLFSASIRKARRDGSLGRF